METSLDFLSSILDEIALEGLDGITLYFMERLENRPHFQIELMMIPRYFVGMYCVHKDIEIYELPEPREFLPVYNRYDHLDPELGIVLEPEEDIKDLYPIEFISDGEIRGSCSTYESRKCITSDIRYDDVLLISLNEAVEKWEDSLVLVASAKARLLSLIGTETNPLVDLSLEEYCFLERIGRSRYLGEVTQGVGGLLALNARFCKQLHYHRKKLTMKGLVTKQLHYMRNRKGIAITGSLFHLTRFYVQRKTKMEFLMKCMCDLLKSKPGNREVCKILRQELGVKEGTFKKLFYRAFQKCVKIVHLPYREFYPNATQKESFTVAGQERIVKVVQLLRHCDDEEKDDDEEEDLNGREPVLKQNVYFDCSKLYHNIPLVSQMYFLIKRAGPEGISAGDLGRALTLPRLDIRSLLKVLKKKNYVVDILQDRGRQKERKYISKIFEMQNEAYSKVKEQEEQFTKESLYNMPKRNLNSAKRKQNESADEHFQHKKVRFNDNIQEVNYEGDKEKTDFITEVSEQSNFSNIEAEIHEIHNAVFTGKSPKLMSFSEKQPLKSPFNTSTQMTYRKLKRTNIILDYIKSVRLSTISDLQKFVMEKEKEEKYDFRVDKKSTARLVYNLNNLQKLKIFKAVLKLGNKKTEIELICDISVEPNDPCIQGAIEQAKFKYFSVSKDKARKIEHKQELSEPSLLTENNVSEKPVKKTSHQPSTDKYFYNIQPKFVRIRTLHQFLFYLVREYEGNSSDSKEEPIVYHESLSWKRFIPPLPNNAKEGWCFLADIYSRMPLSVFVKIVNIRHKISNLNEYLEHEEKAHYLLKHLSQDMRNDLLNNRKYLFSTNDVIRGLTNMGLVSIGPQVAKEKDQVYLYIHKNASLKDTTVSTPGYIHINKDLNYEIKSYTLNSLSDVENFWFDLESISFHTPLGKYSAVAGKTIAISDATHKPELLETLKNKNFDDICDVGDIPGDGLGAAGYDSALFLHARRNWQSTNHSKVAEKQQKNSENSPISSYSIQLLLKNKETLAPENRGRLQRFTKNKFTLPKDSKAKKEKQSTVKKSKADVPLVDSKKRKRIKYRTVRLRKPKERTPYYDEKDKAALQKMSKARCEWSAQEDSFLLLCKVASTFLDSTSRALVVPYTVVRDLLHKHLPELSANKSSRACQRRLRYMLLNPTTTNNVSVFLGEARQDIELVKEFDKPKPLKTQEKAWAELFTAVLNKLQKKFILPASDRCKNIILPNSMDKFNERFEITSSRHVFMRKNHHKVPTNAEEIKYFTLYSLIVSAMAIREDDRWSYLLRRLYGAYPENVLRSVVARLRGEKVIAIKKKSFRKDLQRSLRSTFPYRFSVTYENTLITKFPGRLFGESKELLNHLEDMSIGSSFELKGDIAPGYTAAILSLNFMQQLSLYTEIPDQIILFDMSLSKEARTNIVERMIQSLSDKESVELSRLLNSKNDDHNSEEISMNNSKIVKNPEDLGNSCHLSEGVSFEQKSSNSFHINEGQRSTNVSRFALYLLRQELSQPPIERVQHSQDYIVLNSCRLFCTLQPSKPSVVLLNPPEIAQNHSILENVTSSQFMTTDNMMLSAERASEIVSSLISYIPPEAFVKNQSYVKSLENVYSKYSVESLEEAKCIFNTIFESGVTGILEKELWYKFRHLSGELSLFEHLHLFREAVLILRVGTVTFTYVCVSFAECWVVASYKLPDNSINESEGLKMVAKNNAANLSESVENYPEIDKSQYQCASDSDFVLEEHSNSNNQNEIFLENENLTKRVYFLPRTWRYPDGSLNKPALIELLSAILGYIISLPGIPTSRVCDKFSQALQPVHTLELIEILEKSYCIYKYYCRVVKKPGLFSKVSEIYVTQNPEPDDKDHLEPLPDAVCKMARLQEHFLNQ
ncbi:general transcription factor 3C polypeptide 1-like [Stegodyphus dumicola]|uniref:general transcription factor 3C polypeptide 1-like n=1 Tax=Stegodyphus dumicola TaxID=202533 RepID=UPI0015AD8358|nr:general transcription factor 3C polypeptide 1-like [Stegodyphus dumicola]